MGVDFKYNGDRTQVICRVCSAGLAPGLHKWIAVRSALAHLTHEPHLKTVRLAEEAKINAERLRKEREADSATNEFRDIQFAKQHFKAPLASTSSRVMSEAEAELWADYRTNGAEFSAGDDVEDPEVRKRQLRKEAECFGLWNPGATARRLGFGDHDMAGAIEEDDEDDFLAEIMRNTGEFRPLRVGV